MHTIPFIIIIVCTFDRIQATAWVKDLDLRTGDKDVVLAESGMLSDRHMYAAHKLMRMQFPNIKGCYSTQQKHICYMGCIIVF